MADPHSGPFPFGEFHWASAADGAVWHILGGRAFYPTAMGGGIEAFGGNSQSGRPVGNARDLACPSTLTNPSGPARLSFQTGESEGTAWTRNYTIFVGTIGNSLRCSRDGGDTWKGAPSDQPLPDSGVGGLEGNVRALAVYPDNPHRILAGSDRMGIYRSDDNGESWRLLKSPMEGMEIWSIDVDPVNSDNIYVGTRPKGFRSRDGGESWEKMDISVDEGAPVWPPRTTKITVDPRDHRTIWASAEVDGVHKST